MSFINREPVRHSRNLFSHARFDVRNLHAESLLKLDQADLEYAISKHRPGYDAQFRNSFDRLLADRLQLSDMNVELGSVLTLDALYFGSRTRDMIGAIKQKEANGMWWELDGKSPPFAEQLRIVAKLEKLLNQVDACKQRLAKIPPLLKRFRQSVLAAACSGRLTADWRSTNPVESSDDELPEGWRLLELKDVAETIDPNPSHRYPSYKDGSVPILATEQMRGLNGWDISNSKLVNPAFYAERSAAHGFRIGDIIFARKGRLGLARRPPQIPQFVFSHTVFIIRTHKNEPSDYLLWYLRQDTCVTWLLQEMNSNTGVPTLGKGYMERLPIAIPSQPEQQEIVRRVENLFALADRIEARFAEGRKRVDSITQAILAKAFRGELVPTELELAKSEGRSFESAGELLERVSGNGGVGKKKTKGTEPNSRL